MDITFLVGALASVLSMSFDIPQILKFVKTKSVNDISFSSLLLKGMMVLLWSIYGILIGNIILMVTNFVCTILVIILIVLYVRFK